MSLVYIISPSETIYPDSNTILSFIHYNKLTSLNKKEVFDDTT